MYSKIIIALIFFLNQLPVSALAENSDDGDFKNSMVGACSDKNSYSIVSYPSEDGDQQKAKYSKIVALEYSDGSTGTFDCSGVQLGVPESLNENPQDLCDPSTIEKLKSDIDEATLHAACGDSKPQEDLQCAKDIGCTMMNTDSISATMPAIGKILDKMKPESCKSSQKVETNCLGNVAKGLVSGLHSLASSCKDIYGVGKEFTKEKLRGVFGNASILEEDKKDAELLNVLRNLPESMIEEFKADPIAFVAKMGKQMINEMITSIKAVATCEKWEGEPLKSECAVPVPGWNCLGCAEKANVICAGFGYLTEKTVETLIMVFLTSIGVGAVAGAVRGTTMFAKVAEHAGSIVAKTKGLAKAAAGLGSKAAGDAGKILKTAGGVILKGAKATVKVPMKAIEIAQKAPGLKQWVRLNEVVAKKGSEIGQSAVGASKVSTAATEAVKLAPKAEVTKSEITPGKNLNSASTTHVDPDLAELSTKKPMNTVVAVDIEKNGQVSRELVQLSDIERLKNSGEISKIELDSVVMNQWAPRRMEELKWWESQGVKPTMEDKMNYLATGEFQKAKIKLTDEKVASRHQKLMKNTAEKMDVDFVINQEELSAAHASAGSFGGKIGLSQQSFIEQKTSDLIHEIAHEAQTAKGAAHQRVHFANLRADPNTHAAYKDGFRADELNSRIKELAEYRREGKIFEHESVLADTRNFMKIQKQTLSDFQNSMDRLVMDDIFHPYTKEAMTRVVHPDTQEVIFIPKQSPVQTSERLIKKDMDAALLNKDFKKWESLNNARMNAIYGKVEGREFIVKDPKTGAEYRYPIKTDRGQVRDILQEKLEYLQQKEAVIAKAESFDWESKKYRTSQSNITPNDRLFFERAGKTWDPEIHGAYLTRSPDDVVKVEINRGGHIEKKYLTLGELEKMTTADASITRVGFDQAAYKDFAQVQSATAKDIMPSNGQANGVRSSPTLERDPSARARELFKTVDKKDAPVIEEYLEKLRNSPMNKNMNERETTQLIEREKSLVSVLRGVSSSSSDYSDRWRIVASTLGNQGVPIAEVKLVAQKSARLLDREIGFSKGQKVPKLTEHKALGAANTYTMSGDVDQAAAVLSQIQDKQVLMRMAQDTASMMLPRNPTPYQEFLFKKQLEVMQKLIDDKVISIQGTGLKMGITDRIGK